MILFIASFTLLVTSQLSFKVDPRTVPYETTLSENVGHYYLKTNDMKIIRSGDSYEFVKGTKKFTMQQETISIIQPQNIDEWVQPKELSREIEVGFISSFVAGEEWNKLRSDIDMYEYTASQEKCPYISFILDEGEETTSLSKRLLGLNCHKDLKGPTIEKNIF